MHQQPLPILSLVSQNFMFQPAVLLLLFQALAIFCTRLKSFQTAFSHFRANSLLDLDQCSFSQHTVFIPELLMVCSKQQICICINEQNNSWSHRSISEKHRGTPLFCACLLYNLHLPRTQRPQRCADACPC